MGKTLALRPEHFKYDQNPQFLPLSEATTSFYVYVAVDFYFSIVFGYVNVC